VEGDSLGGLRADLTTAQIDGFHDGPDPHASASTLLQGPLHVSFTILIVFNVHAVRNPTTRPNGALPTRRTLSRENTCQRSLPPQGDSVSLSYADGLGREISRKIQAEPGPLLDGGRPFAPRWVGGGWTIFNNKGKPVRQYEPFFQRQSPLEFGVLVGVSPSAVLRPGRARGSPRLHPDHTWEKRVFDSLEAGDLGCPATPCWLSIPRTDPDVGDFFKRLPDSDYLRAGMRKDWAVLSRSGRTGGGRRSAIHATTLLSLMPTRWGALF